MTFTKKAQLELSERIRHIQGGKSIHVSTFHSLTYQYMKKATSIKNVEFVDLEKAMNAIKKELSAEMFAEKSAETLAITFGSWLKALEDSEPQNEPLKSLYAELIKRLDGSSLWPVLKKPWSNFDVLMYRFVKDLLNNPELRKEYMERYDFVLVDEYQDNTLTQEIIARLLAGPRQNLFAVGDDDQVIYSFAGSDPTRILQAADRYPSLQTIVLQNNYRSHPHIVETARTLIRYNQTRTTKQMIPKTKQIDDGGVFPMPCNDGNHEAEFVLQEVQKLRSQNVVGEQIAILCRSRLSGTRTLKMLYDNDIPLWVKDTGAQPISMHPLFREASLCLEALNEPTANDTVRRLWLVDKIRPSYVKIRVNKIQEYLAGNNDALKKLRSFLYYLEKQNTVAARALQQWLTAVENGRKAVSEGKSLIEIAQAISCHFTFVNHHISATQSQSSEATDERKIQEIWASFLDRLSDQSDLKELTKKIETAIDKENRVWKDAYRRHAERLKKKSGTRSTEARGQDEGLPEEVRVFTIHASKGGEFDHVFLVGADQNTTPSQQALNETENKIEVLEEERRIFYIAMTRAKFRLHITWAGVASPFLEQALPIGSALANNKTWLHLWKVQEKAERLVADIEAALLVVQGDYPAPRIGH